MLKTDRPKIEVMRERQKQRNDKTKYWAAVIGQNMSIAVCVMMPVLLVSLMWTDTSLPKLGISLAMDTLLTAALFIFSEWAAINVGIPSGKLDDDYIRIMEEYGKRKKEVKEVGILKMGVFCEWQIDEEMIAAKKDMCRKLKIDWKTYRAEMEMLNRDHLMKRYGRIRGIEIWRINKIEPIDLTPELILGERNSWRGGISISGDEYVDRQKYGKSKLARSVLSVVLTVGIGFSLSPGVTWGKVVYTIYRMIAILIRMKMGFDKGAKAYNSIEVKHRESQIYYMDKYMEFLNTDGLYEIVAKKYGEYDLMIPERRNTSVGEVSPELGAEDYEASEPSERTGELHAIAG